MIHPTVFDIIVLLLTGLTAAYLLFRFWQRWSWEKKFYVWYYMMGFLVLLISGLLLIFLGYKILGTPFVLTVRVARRRNASRKPAQTLPLHRSFPSGSSSAKGATGLSKPTMENQNVRRNEKEGGPASG